MILNVQMPQQHPAQAQNDESLERAVQTIIAAMSPQERVGQLMMVTFEGSYLGQDSDIARLINDYHIGGVLLLAENDNINGRYATPGRVASLTSGLQRITYQAAQDQNNAYLPLLIATEQHGDGLPDTQLIVGTTPLPSYMALGATWIPEYAYQVGQVSGQELSAMGINLLLGPSLDVATAGAGDNDILGVQTFGGEPYWVGRMGTNYIQGLRAGSQGRLLIVAQHWPGLGASDRELNQEVPVVPRSAEELRRVDLVPFFAVTGGASDPSQQVDGLQCANLRYQGESLRAETRPVCVDEAAFRTVMDQAGYGDWRDEHIIVSDALGTRALRRWYNIDPFPHRQVARDALFAGNDILLLADFGPEPNANAFANISDTIQFFTEGYQTDPVFAARVNQALRRIVRQKLTLYGTDFTYETLQSDPSALARVGNQDGDLFEVAQAAITLLSPAPEQLMPPPQVSESIVIFSDTRQQQQCSFCPPQALIPLESLQQTLRSLYGDQGSGQISDARLASYSLDELADYLTDYQLQPLTLNAPLGESLASDLPQADWILFAILDNNTPNRPLDTVRAFLEARPDLIAAQTRVVVFAFAAPYYLSPTDISKLSAYYGVYSHASPFINAAARALFQETPLAGSLPVSVQAVNYDLFQATSPDPSQTLRLNVISVNGDTEAINQVRVGDNLLIQTDPIMDQNGHIVPDGTPVTFTLSFVTEGVQTQQDTFTIGGIAEANFVLRRDGQVEIRVASGQANTSVTFEITVLSDGAIATLQTIEPVSSTPSPEATQTLTVSPSTTPSATSTPSPTASFTASYTPTWTPSLTSTPSPTASFTASHTPTWTPSLTNTPSPTASFTASHTPTWTPSLTNTPSPTLTLSPSPLPSLSPTVVGSANTSLTPIGRPLVSVSDFLLSLAGLLVLIMPAFAAGWATSRSLDGTVRIILGTLVSGLIGYVYYGLGAPGALLLQEALQDLAAMFITFIAGAAGLLVTWWTVRQIYQ
jgi:beta-N-acetylhexosaminidase